MTNWLAVPLHQRERGRTETETLETPAVENHEWTGMWFVNTKSSKFKDFLFRSILLTVGFWPEAEDRALRGRNLSAVFKTLNRQVGKPLKRLPYLCTTWRVE